MSHSRLALARPTLALLTLFGACGGGGGSGGGSSSTNPLGANVTGTISVDALSISLRLDQPTLVAAEVLTPFHVDAVRFDKSLFVLGIPLSPGTNSIRIRGTRKNGSHVEDVLIVENSLGPHAAVELKAEPRVTAKSSPIHLEAAAAASLGDVRRVLWDFDGDGVLDSSLPHVESRLHTYTAPGSFAPTCTIETKSGLLFTSRSSPESLIGVLPQQGAVPGDTWIAGMAGLTDVQPNPALDRLFVLSASDSTVLELASDGTLLATLDLPGVLQPSAIACAENGDIYVCDTGNARIIRLLAAAGYAVDPSFGASGSVGAHGSGAGELDAPRDVALLRDPKSDELLIGVADTGNARVQVFDESGAVRLQFRGDEHGGPAFVEPVRVESVGPYALAVLDRTAASLRCFDVQGRDRGALSESAALFGWTSPSELEHDTSGSLWAVADGAQVHLLGADGAWLRSFAAPFAVSSVGFLASAEATRLVLCSADPNSTGVQCVTLEEDAPGVGLTDVVSAFANAVSVGDLEAARAKCSGELVDGLDMLFADALALEELQALLSSVTSTHVVDVRGSFAQLESSAVHSGSSIEIEWLLTRSSADRLWRVVSF